MHISTRNFETSFRSIGSRNRYTMAARYCRSRSRSWLLFATRAPHRQTSASRERDRQSSRKKRTKKRHSMGEETLLRDTDERSRLNRGKVGRLRVEMRGNELRKRWQRTKTLGVRVSTTAIFLSLSLLFCATHTLSLFPLAISALPRHDLKLRRIDAEVYVSSPEVVGCKLCHYSIIHPSSGSMVDEHRLSHSNNANSVAKKKEGGEKPRERVQRRKVVGAMPKWEKGRILRHVCR